MATPVQMPKMGISVESCILSKWHKKPGESVAKGDVLFTYETDKTTVDEEAAESGILLAVFYEEGDDVPAMNNVAVIGKAGEAFEEFRPTPAAAAPAGEATLMSAPSPAPAGGAAAAPAGEATLMSAPSPAPAGEVTLMSAPAISATSAGGKAGISPRARSFAARHNVDASLSTPSGAEGRITERDVKALIASGGGLSRVVSAAERAGGSAKAAPAAGPEFYDEKLSSVRKFIAKSMMESLSSMAQLTHTASFDATDILNFRKTCKENAERLGLPNITINDIIVFAVSRVVRAHKACNAHFLGESMRFFNTVHMGVAVDTDRGLLVPTLRSAERLSLTGIANEAKALIKSAQSGTIQPDLLRGGTFTISNLGTLGIEHFTPIVNPPQTCILGVNTLVDAVKEEGGALKVYKRMPLSLTYDHRALDGAPASRFLFDLCKYLENFTFNLAVDGMTE